MQDFFVFIKFLTNEMCNMTFVSIQVKTECLVCVEKISELKFKQTYKEKNNLKSVIIHVSELTFF